MKKILYEILRKYVANKATGNLGKVIIYDDKIVCNVEGRKLKRKDKHTNRYNLIFKCIPIKDEIYKTYNLQKTVHYIIEDVNFDKEINIMTSMKNCHVTFKNCTFTTAVNIDFADHITFINNTYNALAYKPLFSIYNEGEFCISTRANKNEINKIEFFNDNIDVIYPDTISTSKQKNNNLEIWLYAKEIIMFETDIVNAKSIEIGTDRLVLLNEINVSSEEIEVDTRSLESYYFQSKIKSDVISVNTDHYIGKLLAEYKTLFVNGFETNKNEAIFNEKNLKLQQQRLELLNTFKKIETNAEEQIAEKIKKQPLTKVLKR